jgi:predicted nuclease of predicted toxin-antitoxin system
VLAFHLDEHMDHAIAQALHNRGIDCTTTTDADLLGAADEDHIEFALREQHVIVTNDPDFLDLAKQGFHHAGIAFFARGSRSIGQIVRHLCLMSDCLQSAEMTDSVEYL